MLRARGIGYPSELYLDGSDQHRGWFQLSLLPALGATGQAPFKRLVTHGFIVDKDGRKMSKSLGNTIDVEALLKEHGADVCRWWVAGVDYENDIRADGDFFNVAGESYRKVRNTMRYLLSNLDGFDGAETDSILSGISHTSLEAWMLAQLAGVAETVRDAIRRCAFRDAQQAIYHFANDTLSAVYCAATKDRLYCDARRSPRRRAAQAAMHRAADTLCRLLAPFLPHTADEAFRALTGDDAACIHLEHHRMLVQTCDPRWSEVLAVRELVLAALEKAKAAGIDNRLDAGVLLPAGHSHLEDFLPDLPDLFGVSRVSIARDQSAIEIVDLRGEPRCDRSWRRDGTVRLRSDGGMLSDRDAEAVGVSLADNRGNTCFPHIRDASRLDIPRVRTTLDTCPSGFGPDGAVREREQVARPVPRDAGGVRTKRAVSRGAGACTVVVRRALFRFLVRCEAPSGARAGGGGGGTRGGGTGSGIGHVCARNRARTAASDTGGICPTPRFAFWRDGK